MFESSPLPSSTQPPSLFCLSYARQNLPYLAWLLRCVVKGFPGTAQLPEVVLKAHGVKLTTQQQEQKPGHSCQDAQEGGSSHLACAGVGSAGRLGGLQHRQAGKQEMV